MLIRQNALSVDEIMRHTSTYWQHIWESNPRLTTRDFKSDKKNLEWMRAKVTKIEAKRFFFTEYDFIKYEHWWKLTWFSVLESQHDSRGFTNLEAQVDIEGLRGGGWGRDRATSSSEGPQNRLPLSPGVRKAQRSPRFSDNRLPRIMQIRTQRDRQWSANVEGVCRNVMEARTGAWIRCAMATTRSDESRGYRCLVVGGYSIVDPRSSSQLFFLDLRLQSHPVRFFLWLSVEMFWYQLRFRQGLNMLWKLMTTRRLAGAIFEIYMAKQSHCRLISVISKNHQLVSLLHRSGTLWLQSTSINRCQCFCGMHIFIAMIASLPC